MSTHLAFLCVCFYELDKTATSLGLEGVVMCMNFHFVDCVCWVSLADQVKLELEQAWVLGRPRGKLLLDHLGRPAVTVVGAGSGHEESLDQAIPGPAWHSPNDC